MNYDEFPYACTAEGGSGAYLESVNAAENQAAGRSLGQFLRENNIGNGDRFLVVIGP